MAVTVRKITIDKYSIADGNQKACRSSEIYRTLKTLMRETRSISGERLKINGKLMLKGTILAGDYHAIDQEHRMQITMVAGMKRWTVVEPRQLH